MQFTLDYLRKKGIIEKGKKLIIVQVTNEEEHDQNETLKILRVE
jgi:hypothetical protein